jgi:hypothetical protein
MFLVEHLPQVVHVLPPPDDTGQHGAPRYIGHRRPLLARSFSMYKNELPVIETESFIHQKQERCPKLMCRITRSSEHHLRLAYSSSNVTSTSISQQRAL